MVLLLEHKLFLPFNEFLVPSFVFDSHLDKHDYMANDDLKDDWSPPDAAFFIKVCVAGEKHEVD